MALKPCVECGKEVSTRASTCPHCGVKNPTVSNSAKAAGLLILIVAGIAFFAFLSTSNESQESANPSSKTHTSAVPDAAQKAFEEAACLADLQCAGDKFHSRAEVYCKDLLERQAKLIAKWDYQIGKDGFFDVVFPKFRWGDPNKKQIVYLGDEAKFQNGFGAWQRASYECTFDISSQKPVSAEFFED